MVTCWQADSNVGITLFFLTKVTGLIYGFLKNAVPVFKIEVLASLIKLVFL